MCSNGDLDLGREIDKPEDVREDQSVFDCLAGTGALEGGLGVGGVADEGAGVVGGGRGGWRSREGDVGWGNGVCVDGPFGEGGGIHEFD